MQYFLTDKDSRLWIQLLLVLRKISLTTSLYLITTIPLTDEDKVKLYHISILLYPLRDQMLSEYLQINNGNNEADILLPFIERLIERGIFDKKYEWFRHDLIKKCFEDDLGKERKKRYHNRAADFYLKLFEGQQQLREKEAEDNYDNNSNVIKLTKRSYEIAIGCANHLHNAGRYEESYTYNERLANYASNTIGDLDLAERCYKMAIDDAEKLGNLEGKIKCIHDLSWRVYYLWGRYDEALAKYQYVLKYSKDIGNRSKQSIVLNNMGLIYQNRGDYDTALSKYNESLEIKRQLGDKQFIASSLNNIGSIYENKGDYDAALDKHNESLEIKRQLGDKQFIASSLNNIANVYYRRGEYDAALDKHNESLEMARQLGDKNGVATSLNNIGSLLISRGKHEEALLHTLQAYSILQRLQSLDAKVALNNLTSIKNALGEEKYQKLVSNANRQ